MSEQATPRVIKKYPNRRLYDTAQSRYITLSDIRRLVVEKQEFIVIDQKTHEDITRSILLQVIAEQENGEPMMSQDFLSQVIRSYGSAMQGFVGSYLENSLKLFANQQQQMRERMTENAATDPFTAFANLTQKNMEFWRGMQDQFFNSMSGSPPARKAAEDEETPISGEDHKAV
ncbi:MAG TPA: polyhydroxyalkanoate synthesis repressor PhaR [Steroidobacteraceae bacterium]|nr:polyhydroxyalkanoate synthesis repressor PhaR [Steroidobacteraceae bacterium]